MQQIIQQCFTWGKMFHVLFTYAHFVSRIKIASRTTSTFILHFFQVFKLLSGYVAILMHRSIMEAYNNVRIIVFWGKFKGIFRNLVNMPT